MHTFETPLLNPWVMMTSLEVQFNQGFLTSLMLRELYLKITQQRKEERCLHFAQEAQKIASLVSKTAILQIIELLKGEEHITILEFDLSFKIFLFKTIMLLMVMTLLVTL